MTIQAQLPDGTTLQFPDGTPDAVVNGAVKQHVAKQPGGEVETPEAKLGFTPAPPEEPKPPATSQGPGQGAFGGNATIDPLSGAELPGKDEQPPVYSNQPGMSLWLQPNPGAIGRIAQAASEGYQASTPDVTRGQFMSPINYGLAQIPGVAGAIFRGGQQFVTEALPGGLGRDIAAMPEAFPFGSPNVLHPAVNPEAMTPQQLPFTQRPPPFKQTGQFVPEMYGERAPTGEYGPPPPPTPTPSAFAPPNAQPGPTLTRLNQLIQADIDQAARRPSEIPPTTTTDPLTGQTTPIQQPPNPADRAFQRPVPAAEPPPAEQPASAQPAPGPASAGAAASREGTPATELGLSPKEETAYRSTAEGNKLLEPQEPGIRDNNQYLPGERINEAEASQDVETARRLKSLRQQTPQLDAELTGDENFNNNLRTNAINNALPGRVQIQQAEAARTKAIQDAEPKVFGPNTTSADVQPVVENIQQTLSDPKNRQNTTLQQYVRPLLDRLQNADGTPKITDPKELWSFRQDVQHLTSNAAQRGDPNLSRVSGVLGNVLDAIDNQIEAAAPGYKAQLRDDYRTRSQQIDAMTALNDERFKLFDSQNKPNYNAVQSLMRRIVDARQTGDPYEPFTHVPQETLDQLWNIRDSMRRTQAADRLAAPKGSPTSQNFGDALRIAGRQALEAAAPTTGAVIGSAAIPIPGVGPALGIMAGTTVNHLLSARAMAQRLTEGRGLMTPRNQLTPP